MVAVPISYDQPGVATRIAYHGVGEFLEVDNLTIDGLHELIHKVLSTRAYHEKAQYFRDLIAKRPGLDVAVEAIERAFEQAIANGLCSYPAHKAAIVIALSGLPTGANVRSQGSGSICQRKTLFEFAAGLVAGRLLFSIACWKPTQSTDHTTLSSLTG